MIFTKTVFLCCCVAMVLALCADTTFALATRVFGGATIFAKQSGWLLLYLVLWVVAFVAGWWLARLLRLFPFMT